MTSPSVTSPSTAHVHANSTLANLYTGVPLMRGSLLASVDGRVLAADLDEDRQNAAAAVIASGFALGSKLGELLGPANVSEMTVRTDDGLVSLYAVGSRAVLAAMAMPDANLGLLHIRARLACTSLEPLVPALLGETSS